MSTWLSLSVVRVALQCVAISAAMAQAQHRCPFCVNDLAQLSGHGAAPDNSGRRVIYVLPDVVSLNEDPTLVNKVYQGIDIAAGNWNAKSTCYYFTSNLPSGQTVDIYVKQGVLASNCAENDATVYAIFPNYPHHITIQSSLLSDLFYTSGDVGTVLTHEIGHSIGLTNSANDCDLVYSLPSIMEGADASCRLIISAISAQDVAKTNQHCTSTSTCDVSRGQTSGYIEPRNCPSGVDCAPGQFQEDDCYYDYGCQDGYLSTGSGCCYNPTPILIDVNRDGFDLTTIGRCMAGSRPKW